MHTKLVGRCKVLMYLHTSLQHVLVSIHYIHHNQKRTGGESVPNTDDSTKLITNQRGNYFFPSATADHFHSLTHSLTHLRLHTRSFTLPLSLSLTHTIQKRVRKKRESSEKAGALLLARFVALFSPLSSSCLPFFRLPPHSPAFTRPSTYIQK